MRKDSTENRRTDTRGARVKKGSAEEKEELDNFLSKEIYFDRQYGSSCSGQSFPTRAAARMGNGRCPQKLGSICVLSEFLLFWREARNRKEGAEGRTRGRPQGELGAETRSKLFQYYPCARLIIE